MSKQNTAQIQDIPLKVIRAGDNDRTQFDDAKLTELAESIRTSGLAQPITVRPLANDPLYQFEIVAGERRSRACRQLGWQTIPAIVRDLTDEQAAEIMLAENVHRADLDPLDEARAYRKRLDQFGWSVAQVAEKANVNPKRVTARLALLDLIPEMQAMLRQNQIPAVFGEMMAPLDTNRQRIAMQYLVKTEHPLIREFRAVVGELLSQQAQDTMFDADAFIQTTVQANATQRSADLATRRFPIDPLLPRMERVGGIGATFEHYLAALQSSDDPYARSCAPIVGAVYDSLLRGGLAYTPGTSPKRKA